MKLLAVITARAHSKRLPNKNFRLLRGKSLTQWAVYKAAKLRELGLVENIYLSTDSQYLMDTCSHWNLFSNELRCADLAGSAVRSVDVVLDVLERCHQRGVDYDGVILLQPTSPLCRIEDLCGAIALFDQSGADSLVSACELPGVTVNGLYQKMTEGFLPVSEQHNSGVRRQELPPVFLRNGAIFITKTDYMRRNGTIISDRPQVYVMPQAFSADVDTFDDWAYICEFLKAHKAKAVKEPRRQSFSGYMTARDLAGLRTEDEEQPVIPDLLRLLLRQKLSKHTWSETEKWFRDHCYFDGVGILEDGEPIHAPLLPAWNALHDSVLLDVAPECFVQACIKELTDSADSVILMKE